MNMPTTHTPGPWSQGPRTATYGKIMSEDTERPCIAHVMQCTVSPLDLRPDEESLANARLIAAAPLLYEALSELLAEANEDSPETGGMVLARMALAKAALALADGQEQP
jgi:hypothetical protein